MKQNSVSSVHSAIETPMLTKTDDFMEEYQMYFEPFFVLEKNAANLRQQVTFFNFFWEISPKSVYPRTHPRVFVRFGRTKGEIRIEKGDFRGDLDLRGLDLFGNQPPYPPTFGRKIPKKRFFWERGFPN